MTMLTHIRGPLERAAYAPARADSVARDARIAMIRRVCWSALMILLAFGALTGIVALKTAVYFWRYHY